jgi:hypothetical protein
MKYAEYINFPNWKKFKDKIIEFRNNDLNTNQDWEETGRNIWWCYFPEEVEKNIPGLIDAFANMGLTMKQMILFNNLPNDINVKDHNDPKSLFIHTDAQDDPESPHDGHKGVVTDFSPVHALNIPLINCEGSMTLFYERINNNPGVYFVNPGCGGDAHQDVKEVARFELHSPAVLRINVPHAVWNPHSEDRVVATFRFDESLEKFLQ